MRRHPWIFSGAIARLADNVEAGETVRVTSHDGAFLAWAAVSPKSQIRARVWSFGEQEKINADLFAARIARARAARDDMPAMHDPLAGIRLVHGESDGLPGVIADRYADTLVVQLLTCGAEHWREAIADALSAHSGCRNIYERSDADVRALEGLAPRVGALRGAPAAQVEICEGPRRLRFLIDLESGQKTGFYLDQAENRALIADLASAKSVLNCFCYSGAFTIAALAGGAANVLSIDSSAAALALLERNLALNACDAGRSAVLEDDVFKALRGLRDAGKSFDLVILDPPKFAPTAAHAERAARAYKDINLLAFKLLNPGGRLVTFSCSGGVDSALFQKIVAGAALDAHAEMQIERRLAAAPDHPVLLSFPEGDYLKGMVCRRLG